MSQVINRGLQVSFPPIKSVSLFDEQTKIKEMDNVKSHGSVDCQVHSVYDDFPLY